MSTATATHDHGAASAYASTSTTTTSSDFVVPQPGASLMLSFRPVGRKVVVLGTRRLAGSRLISILEADATPIIVGVDVATLADASEEVRWRVEQGQCHFVEAPPHDSEVEWARLIDEVDDGAQRCVLAVCVTDTLHAGDDEEDAVQQQQPQQGRLSPVKRARVLARVCRGRRIPINVADRPDLCDFSFPAAHRFPATPPGNAGSAAVVATAANSSSLQIAVTTNGRGCRLAGRIRREIVATLPRNVGDAVERVGVMREMAKRGRRPDHRRAGGSARDPSLRRQAFGKPATTTGSGDAAITEDIEEEDLTFDSTPINSPVPQLSSPSGHEGASDYMQAGDGTMDAPTAAAARLRIREEAFAEERKRRMRWVAQMSEYWPIAYLGSLTQADMVRALETYKDEGKQQVSASSPAEEDRRGRNKDRPQEAGDTSETTEDAGRRASSRHSLSLRRNSHPRNDRGHIFLVGSGPGHPGLLTVMAHRLLTSIDTDVVLSDKLVPASILSLIPKSTPLHIARKFPGNAEGAQSELIALALAAARQGKRVIRLKQGDPFVYGRGGEEVLAFGRGGVRSTVVPGISSALAAPSLLGIAVTQRGAADSMTLCTGVGRGGKSVRMPGYERGRSLVVLMGVARLADVVKTLCHGWRSSLQDARREEEQEAPAGTRIGDAFPPFTPIAIIERASSTDQRMVASTLHGIQHALARCGEQRPPGMMLIGWAALALDAGEEGMGNVDVLDDEAACGKDGAELERRDRARVERWLGVRGYLMREGLDEAYGRELALAGATTTAWQEGTAAKAVPPTSTRGPSGWAPARYEEGTPRFGWGPTEEQLPTEDGPASTATVKEGGVER